MAVFLSLPLFLWAALVAAPASAFEFRTVGAADLFGTSNALSTGAGTTYGEVGLTLRADLLDVAGRVDFKLDFWGRANLTGSTVGVQELRTLTATIKKLGGRVDLTLGRFVTPGGFWLIADGARLDIKYNDWLRQSVYGGLRAFSTARRNLDLTPDRPTALPIAGTSLVAHHRLIDVALTFTYAQDSVDLPYALDPGAALVTQERTTQDEFFLDLQTLILPSPTVFLAGGASLGTRYDVHFAADNPVAPAQIGVTTLGAVSAWGMGEWRPVKPLRIQYSVNFERIRLVESDLPIIKADGTPVVGANGSFLDNSLRAVWLAWRSLRLEAQYRLRYRENTFLEHHAVLGLRGDDLWKGFGGFASVGVDATDPRATTPQRVLYSGGLSFVRTFQSGGLDVRAGVLFTDGIGSGLLFSQASPSTMGGVNGASPVQLFPYVLETNRVAFFRFFGHWKALFGGIDVEQNLDLSQLRGLLQIGWSQ